MLTRGVGLSSEATADFIAGPPPGNVIGNINHASARNACRRWGRGEFDGVNSRALDGRYAAACDKFLAQEGNPRTGGSNDPAFTGGQCLFEYRVTGGKNVTRPSGQIDFFDISRGCGLSLNSLFGPLDVFVGTVVQGPEEKPAVKIAHRDAAGNPVVLVDSVFGVDDSVTITSFNPEPCDPGQPDECGNPPPEYQPAPPAPIPPPGPIVVPDPIIGDTEISVDIGPDGTITLCDRAGDCVTFDPNGPALPPIPGPDGGPGLPGPPDSPDSPPAPGPGEEPDPPEEDQRPTPDIRGVLVIVDDPIDVPLSQWWQDGAPDLYLPRLGNIYFWYPIGESSSGWVGPIDVRQRRQIIFTPGLTAAQAFRFVPAAGIQAQAFAITLPDNESSGASGEAL